MARGELEGLFERYRESSDFKALARVFDELAPRMLALARHLAPDKASAEDLVQATFLAAIEHRERFDPERDLSAWLAGILTNKAKLAQALRARAFEPERLAAREEPDPSLDLELREFVEALDAALERVPVKYRKLLREHLADGKKPDQIARETGAAPGTVRVQLHRGLAKLRRLLPASFALGLVASLAPRGHAALRAEVLRQARLAAIAAGASKSFVIGGWIVNSYFALLGVGIATGLVGVMWFSSGTTASSALSMPSPEASRGPAEVALAEPAAPASARSALVNNAAPRSDEPYGSLDIELVWHDGSPATDVELDLMPRDEASPAHNSVTIRSDSQGHARVLHIHEGKISVACDRVGNLGAAAEVVRGVSTPVRIEIPRGVDVSGRVVDADHHPLAGASIWLSPHDQNRAWVAPSRLVATSSSEGTFTIRSAGSRTWVSATSPLAGWSRALAVSDDANATSSSVELTMVAGVASVTGIVRSADGNPVPDAVVALTTRFMTGESQPGLPPSFRARTDGLGRYSFPVVPAARPTTLLALARLQPTVTVPLSVAAGEMKQLDLSLPRGVSVHGLVTDAAGAPLAGVYVYDRSTVGFATRDTLRTLYAKSCAAGSFEIVALDAGEITLEASTKIDGDPREVRTQIQASDGSSHEWNPSFADGLAIFGILRNVAGAPLQGWYVQVVAMDSVDGILPSPVTTSADGAFRIRNLRDVKYWVSVTMPDRQTLVERREGVKPGIDPVEFSVAIPSNAPCFVHGRILKSDGEALAGARTLIMHTIEHNLREVKTASDGSFRLQATQHGEHLLKIQSPEVPRFELEIHGLAGGEDRDLGAISMPAGGRIELVLTLPDGSPLEYPMIVLEGHGMLMSSDGRTFSSNMLLPGSYRIFPQANIVTRIFDVEVRANEVTHEELTFEPGIRRVFFFDSDSSAAHMGHSHIVVRRSDGSIVLDVHRELSGDRPGAVGSFGGGFAAGSYRLEATAEDGRSIVHSFEVVAGTTYLGESVPFH